MRPLTLLALALFGTAAFASDETDSLRLLRVSARDVIAKLGEPKEKTAMPNDALHYTYADDLQVYLMKDQVTGYVAMGKSTFTTGDGLGIGATLDQVTAAHGALSTSEEADTWDNTRRPGVLYHVRSVDRYKVTYPDRNVSFIFDSEKKVMGIFVSDCFARE